MLDLSPILANRADVRPELRPNTDIAEFEYSFWSLNNHRTLCSAAGRMLGAGKDQQVLVVGESRNGYFLCYCMFCFFPRFSDVAENAWNEL